MTLEQIKKQQENQLDILAKERQKVDHFIAKFKKFDARCIAYLIGNPQGIKIAWDYSGIACGFFHQKSGFDIFFKGQEKDYYYERIATGKIIGLDNCRIEIFAYSLTLAIHGNEVLLEVYKHRYEEWKNEKKFITKIQIKSEIPIPLSIVVNNQKFDCFWDSDADYKKIAEASIGLLSGKKQKSEFEFKSYTTDKSSSGCFIVTACYDDDPNHQDINSFRYLRDNFLAPTKYGEKFLASYYKNGPYFADIVRRKPKIKKVLRVAFMLIAKSINAVNRLHQCQ